VQDRVLCFHVLAPCCLRLRSWLCAARQSRGCMPRKSSATRSRQQERPALPPFIQLTASLASTSRAVAWGMSICWCVVCCHHVLVGKSPPACCALPMLAAAAKHTRLHRRGPTLLIAQGMHLNHSTSTQCAHQLPWHCTCPCITWTMEAVSNEQGAVSIRMRRRNVCTN
jgi:hypothetical protein